MESWRAISSGSKSMTVVPFSTEPRRAMAPVAASRASASVVFPAPWCPTRATLRIAVGSCGTWSSVRTAGPEPARHCRVYDRLRGPAQGGAGQGSGAWLGAGAVLALIAGSYSCRMENRTKSPSVSIRSSHTALMEMELPKRSWIRTGASTMRV